MFAKLHLGPLTRGLTLNIEKKFTFSFVTNSSVIGEIKHSAVRIGLRVANQRCRFTRASKSVNDQMTEEITSILANAKMPSSTTLHITICDNDKTILEIIIDAEKTTVTWLC